VDGFNVYQWMLLHKRGSTGSVAPAPTPTPTPTPEPEEPTAPTEPTEPSTPPATPGANQLPIAKTSDDRIIPLEWNYMPTIWGNTSVDPDGTIVSYKWTKISGPSSYRMETPTGKNTKLTNLVAGTYVFRLTVTDNEGGVSSDDVTITMTSYNSSTPPPTTTPVAGNKPPVARAGADKSIGLSWNYMPTIWGNTSTDPDGTIVYYKWTKVSGPSSYKIVTPNGKYTKVESLVVGTYIFRLTVMDNNGAQSTDDVVINVSK
jgi:hypothetical protein